MVNAILKLNRGSLKVHSMMHIASVFPKIIHPLAGAALLLSAGCAGGQVADLSDVTTSENFTIERLVNSESKRANNSSEVRTHSQGRLRYADLLNMSVQELYEISYSELSAISGEPEDLSKNEWRHILSRMEAIHPIVLLYERITALGKSGCTVVKPKRESPSGILHLPGIRPDTRPDLFVSGILQGERTPAQIYIGPRQTAYPNSRYTCIDDYREHTLSTSPYKYNMISKAQETSGVRCEVLTTGTFIQELTPLNCFTEDGRERHYINYRGGDFKCAFTNRILDAAVSCAK